MIHKTIHCEKDGILRSLLTKEEILTIQSITITGKVSNDDFAILATMTKDYLLSEIDMSNAFAEKTNQIYFNFDNSKLTRIKLPRHLEKITYAAFKNSQILYVTIPSSVYEIGSDAFENTLLEDIFIPASVRKIKRKAFASTPLRKIEIASKNIDIEYETFIDCKNLSEIYFHKKTPPEIKIFEDYPTISTFDTTLPQNCTVYVPKGSKEIYEKADVWIKFKEFIEKEYEPETEIIEKDYLEFQNKKRNRKRFDTWEGCLVLLGAFGLVWLIIFLLK